MSKIVIGIACHKKSELPDNALYLPIHVGAALAARPLPGLQRDDEGDNISKKNPYYCELTAQYWLWKNVDADYYGLCHYRRFMSFSPYRFDNLSDDNRGQVSVNSLNAITRSAYGLDDAEEMRAIIEGYDVVATQEQNLSRVFTPRGNKSSVYEHFAAHDHDLINVEDLDTMLDIVKRDYPQYYTDLNRYLAAPYFRGYNCFVMKKEYFDELCSYQFDVLGKLEDRIDLSTYDTAQTRIYGFMAEILYSGFVYHLKTSRGARVKDVQMLYFHDTEPKRFLEPVPDALPICFTSIEDKPYLMDVTLSSFLEHMNPARKYDIIILGSNKLTNFYKERFSRKASAYDNLTLRFMGWESLRNAYKDFEATVFEAPQLYLADALMPYSKMLVLNECVLFHGDISPIFGTDMQGKLVAAAKNLDRISNANAIFPDAKSYIEDELGCTSALSFFDSDVMLMDLAAIRSARETHDILARVAKLDKHKSKDDVLNVAFDGQIVVLGQHWNWRLEALPQFKLFIQDAPKALLDEYRAEEHTHAILTYRAKDPWWPEPDEFYPEFWEYARASEFFPFFMMAMAQAHAQAKGHDRQIESNLRKLIEILFPIGSKRFVAINATMPYGSKRRQALVAAYHRLRDR